MPQIIKVVCEWGWENVLILPRYAPHSDLQDFARGRRQEKQQKCQFLVFPGCLWHWPPLSLHVCAQALSGFPVWGGSKWWTGRMWAKYILSSPHPPPHTHTPGQEPSATWGFIPLSPFFSLLPWIIIYSPHSPTPSWSEDSKPRRNSVFEKMHTTALAYVSPQVLGQVF